MGLLQFALGLSRTKGESPKDSYSTKPRENPVIKMETVQEGGAVTTLHGVTIYTCSCIFFSDPPWSEAGPPPPHTHTHTHMYTRFLKIFWIPGIFFFQNCLRYFFFHKFSLKSPLNCVAQENQLFCRC